MENSSNEVLKKNKGDQILVVAEHCCNHMGDFELAKKMIKVAKESGATFAKFQKWNAVEALSKKHYSSPHPDSRNSFGEPYGKHRENLEFTIEQHIELKEYCKEVEIGYACSVFDCASAVEIAKINPEYIKLPSQKNTNLGIYEIVCSEFDGDIHVSTGMTTEYELDSILTEIDKFGALDRTVLYAATSAYPCKFEDLYLLRISDYVKKYGDSLKAIGFSGHHNGIAADIAALTLGARYFERHFTLDRTLKGTDHAASLEPQGLKKLVRDLKNVEKTLRIRPDGILDSELAAYKKVKILTD